MNNNESMEIKIDGGDEKSIAKYKKELYQDDIKEGIKKAEIDTWQLYEGKKNRIKEQDLVCNRCGLDLSVEWVKDRFGATRMWKVNIMCEACCCLNSGCSKDIFNLARAVVFSQEEFCNEFLLNHNPRILKYYAPPINSKEFWIVRTELCDKIEKTVTFIKLCERLKDEETQVDKYSLPNIGNRLLDVKHIIDKEKVKEK